LELVTGDAALPVAKIGQLNDDCLLGIAEVNSKQG
jgi:hypothetical protein